MCEEPLCITGRSSEPSASIAPRSFTGWPLASSICSRPNSDWCSTKSLKVPSWPGPPVSIGTVASPSACSAPAGSSLPSSGRISEAARCQSRAKASGLRAMKFSGRSTSSAVAARNGKRRFEASWLATMWPAIASLLREPMKAKCIGRAFS